MTRWMVAALAMLATGEALPAKPGRTLHTVMPAPKQIEWRSGLFRLDAAFALRLNGSDDRRVRPAVQRFLQRLGARTGLDFNWIDAKNSRRTEAPLQITWQQEATLTLHADEAYRLAISTNRIELDAATDLGILHGLETLFQLLAGDPDGYFFPALQINDAPRFPWRGLLLDVCRHWLPLPVILRNLDGMAMVKLNVLHLHLTEDQGFRIECKTYPKLHQLGSDGNYFTQDEIRQLIAYADLRGIRVVPEFDMPGHVTSWLVGHPELASLPGPYQIERTYGIKDASFDPTRERTYQFLDAFFAEMAALFPDAYIHIGGDENNGKHWDRSESITAFKRANNIADNHALQTYFNTRLLAILSRHGKKMVGWDEILQPGMPKDIVIQSWRGREALVQAARQGYMGLLSNGYYIDLNQPTDFHYLNDPIPPDSPLTAHEQARILGGEATMWSELVTAENVDSRIWPRTAAIAERLWSPPHIRSIDDMYRRLAVVNRRLEEAGLTHETNYGMMLRRLANADDISALRTLVDVLEPIKIYTRHRHRKYTTFTPLTRVVDTARPDAPVARQFRALVENYLADGDRRRQREAILQWLEQWQANHDRLSPQLAASPMLHEIAPRSQQLRQLAEIGMQALALHVAEEPVPPAWRRDSEALLAEAKKPVAETELMIVTAIEKLVHAVR